MSIDAPGTALRVLVFVRCLEIGGAERQLVENVRHLDPARYACTVVSLYPGGPFRAELDAIPHVATADLGKTGRWDWVPVLWRAWRLVRSHRPDVLVGAFDVAHQLTAVLGRALRLPTVWLVANAFMDYSLYDWLPGMLDKVSRRLSSWPDLVVFNSEAGARHYLSRGFAPRAHAVIPNPFDTRRFAPDPEARARLRHEWGLDADAPVIGMVARLDPIKDHATFLEACAEVAAAMPSVRFVCVGDGEPAYAASLKARAAELGLGERLVWTGARRDMPAVYNALDANVLCSLGEGMPNVLGEAMASGVPCIATDVGDSALVVGDTGHVVPVRAPRELAAAMLEQAGASRDERLARGARARQRVVERYDAFACAARLGEALAGVARRA
jgi:glycosyltransferase involved in cell wall biosynthesis